MATFMFPIMRLLICFVVGVISGCAGTTASQFKFQVCTDEWYQFVEEHISTGDGQGHGPDLGSSEWRSVVEFKLGIRDDPKVPPIDSAQWCCYINERVVRHVAYPVQAVRSLR